jgi:putative hydrolase of HD superfamily
MRLENFTPEYILKDVEKLQYLYKLKTVTRYNTPRSKDDDTESVAEHLYGMQLLAQYFLPLEDPFNTLSRAKIYELITVHDFDEIITGDYVSYIKTDAHRAEADEALPQVLEKVPSHIKDTVSSLAYEYDKQISPEAKFVKAIDKIEPLLQVYNEKGRAICHRNQCTAEDSLRIKEQYIESFPFIEFFALTLHKVLINEGYYWEGKD